MHSKPSKFSAEIAIQRRQSVRILEGIPANATLQRRAYKMLEALQLFDAEVSILLTDDQEIQQLNSQYRGVDRSTDVLSFSMREGEGARFAGKALGDIVLSVETALRQAQKAQRPLLDEMTMLLAHAILHLLGWDHQTHEEDERMRQKTDELCLAAGGVPLFAMKGVDRQGRSVKVSEEYSNKA